MYEYVNYFLFYVHLYKVLAQYLSPLDTFV